MTNPWCVRASERERPVWSRMPDSRPRCSRSAVQRSAIRKSFLQTPGDSSWIRGRRPADPQGAPVARLGLLRSGLLPGSLGHLLLGTRARECTRHRFVSFVAGVLVNLVLGALHEEHGGPGLRPRRIVHGDFVLERVRTDAREALDHMRLAGTGGPHADG